MEWKEFEHYRDLGKEVALLTAVWENEEERYRILRLLKKEGLYFDDAGPGALQSTFSRSLIDNSFLGSAAFSYGMAKAYYEEQENPVFIEGLGKEMLEDCPYEALSFLPSFFELNEEEIYEHLKDPNSDKIFLETITSKMKDVSEGFQTFYTWCFLGYEFSYLRQYLAAPAGISFQFKRDYERFLAYYSFLVGRETHIEYQYFEDLVISKLDRDESEAFLIGEAIPKFEEADKYYLCDDEYFEELFQEGRELLPLGKKHLADVIKENLSCEFLTLILKLYQKL